MADKRQMAGFSKTKDEMFLYGSDTKHIIKSKDGNYYSIDKNKKKKKMHTLTPKEREKLLKLLKEKRKARLNKEVGNDLKKMRNK